MPNRFRALMRATATGSTRAQDIANGPGDDLTKEELEAERKRLEKEVEDAHDRIRRQPLSTWFLIKALDYHEFFDEKFDDVINMFNTLSDGQQFTTEQEQNTIDSMVATAIAAAQGNLENPGIVPMVGHDGNPAGMDAQQMAEFLASTAGDHGKTPTQKIIRNFQKLLAKVFFGAAARSTSTLRTSINAVINTIAGISDNIVRYLPEERRDDAKLYMSAGLYYIFSYYIIPTLGSMAFKRLADSASSACTKAGENCTILGGKRKSRRHRAHKKRKSRKGRKSPKRKVKRGKTHKRRARKGRKSHKRKH